MLSSAILSPAPAAPASAPARGNAGRGNAAHGGGGAARDFSAGLVPDQPDATGDVAAKTDTDEEAKGQGIADDGKVVPDMAAVDPLAWLATMMPPPVPVAPPPPIAPVAAAAAPVPGMAAASLTAVTTAAGGAPPVGMATATAASASVPPTLSPLATPLAAAPVPAPVTLAAATPAPAQPAARSTDLPTDLPADLGAPVASAQPVPTAVLPFATDPALASATGPIVIEAGVRPAPLAIAASEVTQATSVPSPLPVSTPPPAPTPPALQPGTAAPAAQVFAAAIHAAARDEEREAAPADRDTPATRALAAAGTAALDGSHVVTAPGDTAAQPSLDLRQERWPHAMIDHIERLRDDANAADTRIRLQPDALGSIDVSVRRDGDTLHVHFAAEQAATRTLLADAQPRLADIAETRGLKLGQSAIGGGTGQGQSQGQGLGQGQPQGQAQNGGRTQPRPLAASPTLATAATDAAISTDTRIA